MIIQKLTLKNFRQYKDATIEFKEGLIGIIGKNGSGKSTIFNAIVCALYGVLPTAKEYMVSVFAEEKASVSIELVFQIDNTQYRIVREFRGKNLNQYASLYKNDVAIATGATDVNRTIEDILGMPQDAFTHSVFAAQGELRQISETGGSDRRELIRKIMGFSLLDEIVQMIRNDRNDKKRFIEGQQAMLLSDDDIKAKESALEKQYQELSHKEKEVQTLQKNHELISEKFINVQKNFKEQQELYIKHNDLLKKQTQLQAQFDNCMQNIAEAKERLKKLEHAKAEYEKLYGHEKKYLECKKKKEELEQARAMNMKKQALQKQYEELMHELHEKEKSIKAEQSELQKLDDLETTIKQNDSRKKHIEQTVKSLQEELYTIKQHIGGIEKAVKDRKKHIEQIEKLGREAECPVCLRPLHEAYDATIAKLLSEIEEYEKKELALLKSAAEKKDSMLKNADHEVKELDIRLNDLQQQKAQLLEKKKNVEKELSELKKKRDNLDVIGLQLQELSTVMFDEQEYANIVEEYSKLEAFHTMFIGLEAQIREIPVLQQRIEQLEKQKNDRAVEIKQITEDIATLGFSEKLYHEVKNDYDSVLQEKEKIIKQLNEEKLLYNDIKNAIGKIDDELKKDKQNRKKIDVAKQEFELLQRLDKIMDGFRESVLQMAMPVIANYASNLFNQLTQGRYQAIEMDDTFNFQIMDDGRWYPLSRFSGGEIDCANLCLRIAISNAIRDFSGSGAVGFMAFDEIFGSQDNERRNAIINALYTLQEQYRQIFIISHIDDVKELFPSILYVQTTANGSLAKWL
ncbi:MAG TPA: SMC family ATPase [Spirochaetota bacterium]|nr:SMC family ATPase [Spirochaetota bacterium]HOM10194.1 SMC family ATPase [Spirochaetota bacterium]HPP48794.1 SMC family ATPase [Spirochaetota bacterium]